MKRHLLLLGATVALGLALAQNNTGFVLIRTPGQPSQLVNTENNPRAATLSIRCMGANIEVVLDPKVALNQSQAPLIRSFNQETRWDFIPESGQVLLPANATKAFIEGVASSNALRLSIIGSHPVWEANFNTFNFRELFRQLPCNTSMPLIGMNNTPVGMNNTPAPATTVVPILDPTVAFIAPLEFSQVFGGRFAPENGVLVWEYNGIRLGLQVGQASVRNLIQNTTIALPRPIQILKNGRTVIPARILSVFNCRIGQTRPTDTTVRVTCGGGSTLLEKDLPRY